MKPRARPAALSLTLILGGCLPLNTFYADGVTVERLARDETACDVAALRDAPVATVYRQDPPVLVRDRDCDAAGNCTYRDRWRPGPVRSVDVNADLRARLKGQCMADKGYRPVKIPACPQGLADAAPPGPTTVLPPLSAASCVIRRPGEGIRIIDRG